MSGIFSYTPGVKRQWTGKWVGTVTGNLYVTENITFSKATTEVTLAPPSPIDRTTVYYSDGSYEVVLASSPCLTSVGKKITSIELYADHIDYGWTGDGIYTYFVCYQQISFANAYYEP